MTPTTNVAQAGTTATQDERMLAGAAYLSSLMGFWFLAPVGIFLWKGKTSRYIGFHAVQATLLHVAMIPLTMLAFGLAFAVEIALALALHKAGPGFEALAGMFFFVMLFGVMAIPFFATIWMGVQAMRGRAGSLPLLGGWAEQISRP